MINIIENEVQGAMECETAALVLHIEKQLEKWKEEMTEIIKKVKDDQDREMLLKQIEKM